MKYWALLFLIFILFFATAAQVRDAIIDDILLRLETLENQELDSRVTAIEQHLEIYPVSTHEVLEVVLAVNGDYSGNARRQPKLSGTFVRVVAPNEALRVCDNVAPVVADGYTWMLLTDGAWLRIASNRNPNLVILSSTYESLRAGESCDPA